MSEPRSVTQTRQSTSQKERIVNVAGRPVRIISKAQADAKISKLTPPRKGGSKEYDLPNGFSVNVVHRGVNGRRNEFFATVKKDGEESGGGYYAQYVTDGSYPGQYSTVSSSKDEAFDNVKKWMKSLIR